MSEYDGLHGGVPATGHGVADVYAADGSRSKHKICPVCSGCQTHLMCVPHPKGSCKCEEHVQRFTAPKPSGGILSDALRLTTTNRAAEHGPWQQNAHMAARAADALDLDAGDPSHWPLLLICLKLARIRSNPKARDNYVDVAGYASLMADVEVDA